MQVQLAALDEQVRAHRGSGLGDGEHERNRVFLPCPAALRVEVTAPEIDDGFAFDSE